MAILRAAPRIFQVDALIDGMRRLAGAIVRVRVGQSGLCTAWYIAPRVVVLPGFALPRDLRGAEAAGRVEVVGAQGRQWTETWSATSTEPPEFLGTGLLGQNLKEPALAVLHLTTPAPERVLPLCFDRPAEGAPVFLFHFPHGRPEIHASFGQILGRSETGAYSEHLLRSEDDAFCYDADTEPGSAGAPILDSNLRVLGMHIGAGPEGKFNYGLPRSLLLTLLRASRWWPEIAAHQQLADTSAAEAVLRADTPESSRTMPEAILVRAAISPSLNPKSLSAAEREALRAAVVDGNAARWTLRPAERRRIIAAAGTIDALQPFRRGSRRRASEPLQRVLDRILDGPPYELNDANEDELAWWIQAADWFAPVAGELPRPADVARELERRRVRSRLSRIAGLEFQGRRTELAALRDWYEGGAGPMVLTGIGGMGKSALVARFASELPDETLLLWLDFDRADLAPDDALSVLTAVFGQAAVQLEGIEKPTFDEANWQDDARRLGEHLAERAGAHPPLLVLDSFEAAQYVERYQELWPVLELLAQGLPALRVCVTGRGSVPGLSLRGKEAQAWRLAGLEEADVRAWLLAKGVSQAAVVDRVIEIARGIPLVLRLAFRLLETGGKVEDLPRDLPEHLVAGYLYDRILDRVQNPEFKPLASGLLVLRRLTLDAITPVLGGLVAFPPGEPASWFSELSREMALVEGGSVLIPRAEVRSATLWLLEHDRPELVRQIDERAAAWYAHSSTEVPENAAELVYHRLRLGDVAGAEQAWHDGSGAFLTYAPDDIRDAAARTWLQQRLGDLAGAPRPLSVWEQDAAERIRTARGRGLDRAVAEILRERPERSEQSPLIFHDAYELHTSGESAKAKELLDRQDPASGPVGRDRSLLRALLTLEAKSFRDVQEADGLLATWGEPEQWGDRPNPNVHALAVLATRLNLTLDLDSEAALLGYADRDWSQEHVLAPVDAASPRLRALLQRSIPSLETASAGVAIAPRFDGTILLDSIEQERRASLPEEPERARDLRRTLLYDWSRSGGWASSNVSLRLTDLWVDHDMTSLKLAGLGWRRWWLATRRPPFLQLAYQLCVSETSTSSPLVSSVLGTLALFAARVGKVCLVGPTMSLEEAVLQSSLARGAFTVRREAWPQLRRSLQLHVDAVHDWDRYIVNEHDQHLVFRGSDLLDCRLPGFTSELGLFLLYLFSPDPLRSLLADAAGAPLTQPLE